MSETKMDLPVMPPLEPMLAKRVSGLPEADGWVFEPKWDGFRALVFRDGDEVLLQSRDLNPLNRYFPELIETLRAQLPPRCVMDGEIVIATHGGLDFDSLQLRLHPAASRVNQLSQLTPASMVFFDLLSDGEVDYREQPLELRRKRMAQVLKKIAPPLHISPATSERNVAEDWFRRFEGAGLDGVIAKPVQGEYESGKRVMLKIKHERECDCVVAGFRWHKAGPGTAIGSLLLGLFNDEGTLQHVGVCASFTTKKREELVEFLAPYRDPVENHPWRNWQDPTELEEGQKLPGGKSRWSRGKDLSWVPVRPELVVEVAYEHMQGTRFRHMSQFRRWRPDRRPESCTYAQLEIVAPQELMDIFAEELKRTSLRKPLRAGRE